MKIPELKIFDAKIVPPAERIRYLAYDRRGWLIGDCFYGEVGSVTGKFWNEHFQDYEPAEVPNEKHWRYSQGEKKVKLNVAFYAPLPMLEIE